MKKLIIIILLFNSIGFSHKHHVHKYLTTEAYKLLKLQFGYDIPKLLERIGGSSDWYNGDGPWQRGYITTGAYREDEEDVVYGYSKDNPPTVTGFGGTILTSTILTAIVDIIGQAPDGFVSSTHFWYADDGDEIYSTIRAAVKVDVLGIPLGTYAFTFTVPNAYHKFTAYANGNWEVLGNTDWLFKVNGKRARLVKQNGGSYRRFFYSGLINLQNNGNVQIRNLPYAYYILDVESGQNYLITPTNGTINLTLNEDIKNKTVWEILGRMCHLLQDMSVPAHANIDPHGNNDGLIPDYYENYFGDDFYWNADNIYAQIGGMINPYLYQPSNPLHFLMYTTNQMSNHFSTQGPHKKFNNDYFSGNGTSAEIAYLNSLNVSQFGIPTSDSGPWNYDAIINVRNRMLPQAIRATAGLLYWFANECNLIPPPPTVAPIISNFTQSPKPIYQGSSGSVTCNLSQGNGAISYNWSVIYGKPGVSVSFYGDRAVVSYNSNSLNFKPSDNSNYYIEAPVGIELQCSVYNSVGSDVKRYVVDLATTPHGCPFVYTWNGDTWVEDNNILPQSQDSSILGQDVTDFYQLYTKPILDEGKYFLAIGEFEEEISYLDQLKLLVVDHPQETFITVDDNGEIIQFAKPAYFANANSIQLMFTKNLLDETA